MFFVCFNTLQVRILCKQICARQSRTIFAVHLFSSWANIINVLNQTPQRRLILRLYVLGWKHIWLYLLAKWSHHKKNGKSTHRKRLVEVGCWHSNFQLYKSGLQWPSSLEVEEDAHVVINKLFCSWIWILLQTMWRRRTMMTLLFCPASFETKACPTMRLRLQLLQLCPPWWKIFHLLRNN